MIRRFLRSRGARKFRRDRMAMVALGVILVYFAVALAVTFGELVTEDEFEGRWGPNQMVGVLEEPTLEARFADASFYVDKIDQALDSRNPQGSLEGIDLFGLVPVSTDPDEMGERLDAFVDGFDELYEVLEEEAFHEDPENLARLAELEEQVMGLFRLADGADPGRRERALWLGTDRQGRSILMRGVYAIKIAFQIGLVASLISVLIGTVLGGLAGFLGGVADSLIVWLYSTFSAIPYIVLLMVLAAMFLGSEYEGTLIPVYTAFCLTFWIAPCRVIRGEVLKLRELEYVQAATAVGFGRMRILLKHIIPNTTHLMFINFSLLFIGAIKAEVILSFLGLGVKNEPSWGVMINQSRQEVLNGFMWQIGTATALMFVLVYAFNILSDALQDAFDPKHV